MATAKKNSTKTASKKTSTGKSAAKKTSGTPRTGTPASMKPISTALNRSGLIAHLAEATAMEARAVRTLMAAFEATILASVHKKGLGSFTLPGLLKINVVNVPAKKKRRGIDPFTKVEREFAAKPASVKIKTRALKKLKDAAL
ncbi:MAG: HU family DNA-binding protein [Caldimonas sp.]